MPPNVPCPEYMDGGGGATFRERPFSVRHVAIRAIMEA